MGDICLFELEEWFNSRKCRKRLPVLSRWSMIYWSGVTIILIVPLSKSQKLKTSKGATKEQYSFKASLLYISTLFLSSFATLLLSKDHFYMGSDGQSELRIVRMETQSILVKVIQDADGPMLTGYEWREYDCHHRSSAFYLGLMVFSFSKWSREEIGLCDKW